MSLKSLIPRIYRPAAYQGRRKPESYFEGWYTKLVDAPGDQIWSFIAGVSYSDDTHAFIQVIHANSGRTWYVRFPEGEFRSSRKSFDTRLGRNRFSERGMELELDTPDLKVSGMIGFSNTHPFPSSLISPGIMGWYSYAPRMECYHGVVSMLHDLSGTIRINQTGYSFEGGKGYIEKDWGRSMPSDWIWIQSNHFENDPGASFMVSLANIPWMGGHFPGFLSYFRKDDKLYRFATYNRSRVSRIEVKDQEVLVEIQNRKLTLIVRVYRNISGVLKAPRHGNMDREIQESIVSTMLLQLKDIHGNILFEGKGKHTGLEIVGDVAGYFANNR